MLIGFKSCVSFLWIFYQKFWEKVFGLVTTFIEWFSIECVYSFPDTLQDSLSIFSKEGRSTTQQNIQDNPTSPIINLFTIFSTDNFRCQVHGSSFGLILELFFFENFRNSEINQFNAMDVFFFLKQNVFRFQISVANVLLMQISNCRKYLSHDYCSLCLS